jgi:hypothetical protein
LRVLRSIPGDASLLAQAEILLGLAKSPAQAKDRQTIAQQEYLERCRPLIDQIASEEERLEMKLDMLRHERTLFAWAALDAQKNDVNGEWATLAVARADKSLDAVEEALAVIASLHRLQVTVTCSPTIKKQKFDLVEHDRDLRTEALVPVKVISDFGQKYKDELTAAKRRVQKWWEEADLENLPKDAKGAPTPTQLLNYRNWVLR